MSLVLSAEQLVAIGMQFLCPSNETDNKLTIPFISIFRKDRQTDRQGVSKAFSQQKRDMPLVMFIIIFFTHTQKNSIELSVIRKSQGRYLLWPLGRHSY